MSLDDLLSQGIAAAKAGQREQARDLLMQVVQQDQYNEKAWLWLSGVVEADEDRCLCLENVLEINPDNTWARRGLDRLAPVSEPPTAPAAVPAPQAQAAPAPSRPWEPAPPTHSRPQEPEEPRGFERLQEPRRKNLKPILIVLAVIAVPGILTAALILTPITWRAAINEKIGFPLLGVISVEHSQTKDGGRMLLEAAGPKSDFRQSRTIKMSGGDTLVIQYTIEIEQGQVMMSLNRDTDIFSEDFLSEGFYDRVPWTAWVEGSESQTARMTIAKSGPYKIWLNLVKFEGQIDLAWQIE